MPRRHSSFAVVLATVAASSVFSTTSSVAGTSEAELCFGQVPTILGTPGELVEGTEGPDVVLTNGAYAGDALGGDDLVCITKVVGERPDGATEYAFVAGTGSDRIDATQAGGGYFYLGPGPDRFTGSDDGFDTVYADDASPEDPDADIVTTGDASDRVISSGADMVDLGAWTDELHLVGDPSGGVYTGETGRDVFYLEMADVDHDWTLNNRTGRLSRDGEPVASFGGFIDFQAGVGGSLRFMGSDAPEDFVMMTFTPGAGWLARKALVDVRMGGGNDFIGFYGGAPGGRFDGGNGTDRFWYYRNYDRLPAYTTILFDLATGLLRDTWAGGATTRRAVHFETAVVFNDDPSGGGPVTLKGTSGPDTLKLQKTPQTATIFGRGGDDHIFGSTGDDILVGGTGDDVATGKSGTDRCDAEIRTNCEF